jgi:nucleoside-diphosphate-sugar epimerase
MRIAVTGALGRAGRWIVPELMAADHEVIGVDLPARAQLTCAYRQADVNDYAETLFALEGVEAVVHLARASPHAGPNAVFRVNTMTTWNVLQAAEALGLGKLVLASSVNAIGAVANVTLVPPEYFPIDEQHPTRAQDPYSISKWAGEQIADGFARRLAGLGRSIQIASFRLHALLDDQAVASAHTEQGDLEKNAPEFWSYTSLRECARACRMALDSSWTGHEVFFVNATDTTLSVPTAQALAHCYAGVPLRRPLPGFDSVLDTGKAKHFFGWEHEITWRTESL